MRAWAFARSREGAGTAVGEGMAGGALGTPQALHGGTGGGGGAMTSGCSFSMRSTSSRAKTTSERSNIPGEYPPIT